MNKVTIGFVPRERFSAAAESLESILQETEIAHDLVVVDCDMPASVRAKIAALIESRPNVRVIPVDRHLLPNEAKNLVIRETETQYLCLIENDNLVKRGWLTKLIRACEEHPADVAVPLLMEGRPGTTKVHFDDSLGQVHVVATDHGEMLDVSARKPTRELAGLGRQSQQFMETHCLLFRTAVFARMGELDESINTSEEVDLSLALQKAGAVAVFEPSCVIHYVLPAFPLPADDQPYFMKKWDIGHARRSHEYLKRKWRFVRFPQILGFVAERYYCGRGRLREWTSAIDAANPGRGRVIVAGMEAFSQPELFGELSALPFTEREGQYFGAPSDDDHAIQELERLRQERGASMIVFLWQSYWQLAHYTGLSTHLNRNYRRVIDSEHMIAFDLSASIEVAARTGTALTADAVLIT